MARPFDHPLCLTGGHFRVCSVRSARLHRLFQVHQTIIRFLFFLSHFQENCVARTAERTTSLHPIGGIDELYIRVSTSRAKSSREMTHVFGTEEFLNIASFLLG